MKWISDPVIIVGMHRSGTSMLARIFERAGIFMGSDLTADHESSYMQRINITWMKAENFEWDKPGTPLHARLSLFSRGGFYNHYCRLKRNPLRPFALLTDNSWGWKDPRNTFTLESWLKIFPGARVVHIYRNGMDVAISLYKRNVKIDYENKWYSKRLESKTECLELWSEYIERSFSYSNELDKQMIHVCFENIINGKEETIAKLESFTGCRLQQFIDEETDQTRTGRFSEGEHPELFDAARKNVWMKKLNYI